MPQAPRQLKWNISLRLWGHWQDSCRAAEPPHPERTSALDRGLDKGEVYIERALSLVKHVGVTKRVLPFLGLQRMADEEFPHGQRYYTKSGISNVLMTTASNA
jgi:hypothetical protein